MTNALHEIFVVEDDLADELLQKAIEVIRPDHLEMNEKELKQFAENTLLNWLCS